MNTRTPLNRLSTLVVLIGCTLAGSQVAAHEAAMSIEDRAPLQATLLPTVSVFADAAQPDAATTWSIAATRPQSVTLMPTMRISAQAEPLAVTMMPVVKVSARLDAIAAATSPHARADEVVLAAATSPPLASLRPVATRSDATTAELPSGRHLQVMPR